MADRLISCDERQMRHLPPEMRRKLTRDNAAVLDGLGGS